VGTADGVDGGVAGRMPRMGAGAGGTAGRAVAGIVAAAGGGSVEAAGGGTLSAAIDAWTIRDGLAGGSPFSIKSTNGMPDVTRPQTV